jgi:hypothetical protein
MYLASFDLLWALTLSQDRGAYGRIDKATLTTTGVFRPTKAYLAFTVSLSRWLASAASEGAHLAKRPAVEGLRLMIQPARCYDSRYLRMGAV